MLVATCCLSSAGRVGAVQGIALCQYAKREVWLLRAGWPSVWCGAQGPSPPLPPTQYLCACLLTSTATSTSTLPWRIWALASNRSASALAVPEVPGSVAELLFDMPEPQRGSGRRVVDLHDGALAPRSRSRAMSQSQASSRLPVSQSPASPRYAPPPAPEQQPPVWASGGLAI